ncbi:MAG: response regulator [Desulfobacteraceae bacterium]|nr:response regulator [Desulfobacteraceae bacterium]MBC2754183.1 response regulator [Desulfobacteraceae bacterium]
MHQDMNRKMNRDIKWEIVLIDDEKGIRKVMAIALKDSGYSVLTAENGNAGVKLCTESSPQLVITDIKMPGMDGLQVLEILKKELPDIEVIVMTAFGDIDTAIRAIQLDASDFITKPINDDALALALDRAKERYLSKKQLKEYTSLLETGWSRATKELLNNFSFQKQIIESSINGIIGCGADEKIKIFNSSMIKMLGYTKSEVVGKKYLRELLAKGEEKRIKEALESESHGGINKIALMESVLLDHESLTIPVRISASVLFEEGNQNGILISVRDLRELRKIERKMADQERILHQDKMMSLGKLAASVVHEINNPLSGILNYLRLMTKIITKGLTPEKIEKFSKYLDIATKETARCSQIVSNLLTFSRKSSLSFEPVDVKELIHRCTLISQHKLELQNITLSVSVDSDIPFIMVDANQIQQCLINLIFNAIDAMPDGGTIDLLGKYDSEKQKAIIYVKDTGTGIDQKDLPHIFEPFFTTKDEGYGVGLGLSTVYGIMERHNGSVLVESAPGKGTQFILEFNTLAKE